MTLQTCVEAILCDLAEPVRAALLGIVEVYKGLIAIELQVFRSQLAILQVTTLPIKALRGLAETAKDAALSAVRLLPTTIIEGCLDLGNLTIGLERAVQPTVAEAEAFLDDLERLLSLEEEITAIIDELVALEALLNEVVLTIELCDG